MEAKFTEIFFESVHVARAYNSASVQVEHYFLAMLKIFPQSLIIKYLETVMSREDWKKLWQNRLNESAKKVQNLQKHHLAIVSTHLKRCFRAIPWEKELLKIDEINETCVFLALLRYQDIDGLTYRNAIEFFKKNK